MTLFSLVLPFSYASRIAILSLVLTFNFTAILEQFAGDEIIQRYFQEDGAATHTAGEIYFFRNYDNRLIIKKCVAFTMARFNTIGLLFV